MTKRSFLTVTALLLAVFIILTLTFALFCCLRAADSVERAVGAVYEQDPAAAEKLILALLEQRSGDGRAAARELGLTERAWSFYLGGLYPARFLLPWGCVGILASMAIAILALLRNRARQREQADLEARVNAVVHDGAPFRASDDTERLYAGLAGELDRIRKLSAAKSEELRTFVENVAHEIKTPVAGIVLTLDLMEEQGAESARLERLRGCVSRIQSYIGELLTLSRLRSGRIRFSMDRVVVKDLIEDLLKTFPETEYGIMDASLEISGDRRRLGEALSNLVRNAIRYGDGSSKVLLSAEALGENVRLRVSGPGTAELPRLERYAVGNEDGTSTGIGLSIAQETAARHSGRLCFSAREGGGLNADLILPVFHLKSAVV